MIKLTYIKSEERGYNIERCLSLMKSEVKTSIEEAKHIVVKIDCVSSKNKESAIHRDALDAVLSFIKPFAQSQIVVAGSCEIGNTLDAFRDFGYLSLQEKYDFSITDLDNDEFEEINLLEKNGSERKAQIAKTLTHSDYLISLSLPKTHESTVYAGAIENVTIGGLARPEHNFSTKLAAKIGIIKDKKNSLDQGYGIINENIKRLYSYMPIKLAVLDGFQVVEGEGPVDGNLVPMHWAITTANPVAADCLACTMLGINYKDVGYLAMLEDGQDEYFIAGDDWQRNIKKIKMHSNFEQAKKWQ